MGIMGNIVSDTVITLRVTAGQWTYHGDRFMMYKSTESP